MERIYELLICINILQVIKDNLFLDFKKFLQV